MSTPDSVRSGILEILPRGNGYLRNPARDFRPASDDAVVEHSLIERHGLLSGALVEGTVAPNGNGKPPRLVELTRIDGGPPTRRVDRPPFEERTAVDPHDRIRLETADGPHSMRVVDLFTPIGKGQRGLIVAPPRSGKTVLLQQVARAVAEYHPELTLMVVLVDERPEEVTEMRRSVRGSVLASSNDRPPDEHIRVAQLAIDRAKRIAESGGHALVLLDSLTRLARAYNKASDSGRTMSGGLDIRALEAPKRLFGAARAFEHGGSLTVLATCLIETNSRMDDVIFQEFKGTGNMELVLDRRLADRRVWPAIDLLQSGTRKEERLLSAMDLERVRLLRRTLADMKPLAAMEGLLRQMAKFPTNAAFLDRIATAQRS
jgi:transcription termination factor Rho